MSISSWYRTPLDQSSRDAPIVDRLNELINRHGRWGFWKCFYWLRQHGSTWNHKLA
ncbi:hypothetical protein OAG99_01555 [Akkermansiaceae bacterium]|nr:hypothetical protein [Akkermansiaceae bacterium]